MSNDPRIVYNFTLLLSRIRQSIGQQDRDIVVLAQLPVDNDGIEFRILDLDARSKYVLCFPDAVLKQLSDNQLIERIVRKYEYTHHGVECDG